MADEKAKTTSKPAADAKGIAPKVAQWRFATISPVFDPAIGILTPPMEITRSFIRTLRMIDESVIVHGRPAELDGGVGGAAGVAGKKTRRSSRRGREGGQL